MAHKKGRRGNSYLRSWSLLLCPVAKVAVVTASVGCVCGPRYVGSCGGWRSYLIEK